FAQMTLLAGKVFLGMGGDETHQHETDKDGDDGGQRHQHICEEHHQQGAKEKGDGGHQHTDALVERLGDHIHVVGDPGEDISVGSFIVKVHRQTVDLLRDIASHLPGDDLRDGGHDKMLQKGEDDAANVKGHQCKTDAGHSV